MVQFKVGDTVTFCVALKPFCGELGRQFYIVHDMDCAVGSCPISPFPFTWDCLTPSGVSVEFQWTPYGYNNTCDPAYKLKSLGTATTDSEGMATLQYQITQNDLDIYNSNIGVFDLRVCFNNGGTENRIYSKARGKADNVIITEVPSTATHVLVLKLTPYPWYTTQGAVDWLVTKISDVNGAIFNIMSSLTGWSYVETIFSHDGTYVYIKVYMREEVQGIQTLSPLTLGQAATIGVAAGITVATVGWIKDWIWGPVSAPEDAGLSNKDLIDAGDKYIKQQLMDCELKICIGPTLTQDQKALCIKNCIDTTLPNWKGYQGSIFPDADHTPLDTGRAEVQKCYDTYNSSGKTPADYQTLTNCMQLKSSEAVTGDTNNTYITYPPNAPAGVTAQELAADCWIAGFVPGTCMLTAKTGKTIAIIGGVVIGGVILISLFKK